jgi:hypothetical protein
MLIQIESVTLTGQSETQSTQPERAIITLTLIQGLSALSISMLISTNKPLQLLTLPTRYELQPEQINALLMSSLITRLQALEASGAGANTPELIHTPSTSTSALQRLVTRIRSFLTSHY